MRRLKTWLQILVLAACAAVLTSQVLVFAQDRDQEEEDVLLPNGKSQKDEILKADHKQNLEDARRLVEVAQGLKAEFEKHDQRVLSVNAIRNTEEIEKLAKRIRGRLRR
jgi:electron transfer flavoprotein alpha subunit